MAGKKRARKGGAKKTAPPGRWRWASPVLVLVVGWLAYCNSFNGPFIFDDDDSIRQNPAVQSFFADGTAPNMENTLAGRPVLRLSLVTNYKLGGWDVWNYHATNVLIHLAGALLLYGIVRRNLSREEYWSDRFRNSAPWLAAVVAAAWAAHPLNTEAVTYIVQRGESMAGLFYLAVIYSLIRQAESERPLGGWGVAGIVACLMGMGTKEIVATAPVMALLYDRTFLAGSFAAALRRRWAFYIGLAATWFVVVLSVTEGARRGSVGFFLGISASDYGRTQLGVIACYLKQLVWPLRLVFDYEDWPIAHRWADVGWGWLTVELAVATAWAIWKKPWLGFLGAWFFAILAPSSSIVPIVTEIAAEHRMYLPMAAPLALAVAGGWMILRKRRAWAVGGSVAAAIVICAYAGLSIARNGQYASTIGMWQDAVDKRPSNARAHFNLGFCYLRASAAAEQTGADPTALTGEAQRDARVAADEFKITLKLKPDYAKAARFLGRTLVQVGEWDEAERFFAEALKKYPREAFGNYMDRGALRARRLQWSGAEADFLHAIGINPRDPQAHYFLATAYQSTEDWPRARVEYENTLNLDAHYLDAEQRLDEVLKEMGQGNGSK